MEVSASDKTVTAGGGCRWRDVDKAAVEHGLATLGGTVNDTGIGGLTLGGGYGWVNIPSLLSSEGPLMRPGLIDIGTADRSTGPGR